jgi:hypothetical protein
LSWPLPEDLDDTGLDARLYKRNGTITLFAAISG